MAVTGAVVVASSCMLQVQSAGERHRTAAEPSLPANAGSSRPTRCKTPTVTHNFFFEQTFWITEGDA